MDLFGIGSALKGVAHAYFHCSRQTGRTTMMIDSIKDGDRIIFAHRNESERVQRICKERGLDVDCIFASTRDPSRIFEHGSSLGRTVFDHGWVEEYYLNAMDRCAAEIRHFETGLSGYGEAHRKTKREASRFVSAERSGNEH